MTVFDDFRFGIMFKAIIPNGQPKPLVNRYNQYLSR